MDKKVTIELHDLTTGYEHKPVTSGIDGVLYSKELTCLLGSNGAGKSTLLKTISAFIPPLEGQILIKGENIRKFNLRQLAKTVGVVLTERPSTVNMSVEELVAVGRSPYTSFLGSLSKKDIEFVEESLRYVGIYELRNRMVNTLSDGERQKVFIAKALAQQTEVIVLDEPTAFLDYPSKVEIMNLLSRLAKEEDKTIFLSTHDLELALQIADRIWLLDRNMGLNVGTPCELASNGKLAEYFETETLKFIPEEIRFVIIK